MFSAFTLLALATIQRPKTAPMEQTLLKAKQTLKSSARITPKVYRIPNDWDDAKKAAIYVKGDNVTIDFQGATLEGTLPTVEPNERKGTGIFVTGKNIVLKNLKIRGYKIALAARNAPGLKLINIDASYNWKQRLLSDLDKEDGADWMRFHRKEKDEWLRYGAAFYLRDCDGFEVKNCRAVGGQCGLMITNCNKGLIWNNDFSFLSAVGLGMYQSSDNRIFHNKLDWCVRGFSYGKYNRGQDSTGILIYEQSHRNVFAYNSATHGGDGFFLWAGQSTMDTGKGGCNDNLLYANDFSHSPANGIEATFSRNHFIYNLMLECWHGIWGGYSFESKVMFNEFGYNAEAIAWEHGQDNVIADNTFWMDGQGLVLWSNPTQDPNWGYAKARDTRSRNWTIRDNAFNDLSGTAINLRRSSDVLIEKNTFKNNAEGLRLNPDVTNLVQKDNKTHTGKPNAVFTSLNPGAFASGPPAKYLDNFNGTYFQQYEVVSDPKQAKLRLQKAGLDSQFNANAMKGGQDPFLRRGVLRGWRYILVDQWGPYDFKSPVLWPRSEIKDRTQTFEILGPKGVATVVDEVGTRIDAISTDGGVTWTAGGGRAAKLPVPCFVRVAYGSEASLERKVMLEYRGAAVTDYRGIVTPKGKPFPFGFRQFFIPIDWTVKFFAWSADTDPRTKGDAFKSLIEGPPVKTEKVDRINYAGNVPGVPGDRYATVAEGTFEVPKGDYVLNVTTDDGCRVWVDGELVIKDAWKYQGPTPYAAELKLGGKHRIRVEHFEIDGYSALRVELVKKK